MTEENKPLTVTFAPGAFDAFDGTQEELDELVKEIQEFFANATPEEIAARSRPLDEVWDEMTPEEQALMESKMNAIANGDGDEDRVLN